MIDEINYFPKRENYQKKKKIDEDWNELKKVKQKQERQIPGASKKNQDPSPHSEKSSD